jgi:soluble lytic murein transglycosylase-like protein
MTLLTRMQIAALAMICTAAIATQAAASGPQALSPWDAQNYRAAFEAAEQGDFIGVEAKSAEVKDKSLLGHLTFRQLMTPSGYKATFQDLTAWLSKYADLPGADRVFSLAKRRKPDGAADPRAPVLAAGAGAEFAGRGPAGNVNADKGRLARDAFYSGDVKRAQALAAAAGERWIAGLSAYRLKNYALAESYFAQVSRDDQEDPWLRAAAGYWASRSASAEGDPAMAASYLAAAAAHPETFYGMIAERQAGLQAPKTTQAASTGEFILAAYTGPTVDTARFIRDDPRAHRAAALAQIGRMTEAGLELRAGLSLAKTPAERERWMALIMALNAPIAATADVSPVRARVDLPDYPAPLLEPKFGFTIDKALVYAIVRQESRFNPSAVSGAGAVGLMQLMPEAAARAAGDDKLKTDMSPLFDPAFNLRVGQDYVAWLMERGVGYDILRTVAAYNGGPGTLQRTAQILGDDADSLMIIECLPAQETRNYVEKVMAAYWTYRKMWGQESKTLDAVASGAKFVDARLDR